MDMGKFNLFIKMIQQEYALNERELQTLTGRMLADSTEFERVWSSYKNKTKTFKGGVDSFKATLQELLN